MKETFNSWGNLFLEPLQDLSSQVLSFLPQLISAVIVLIVGMIVVGFVIKLLKKALSLLPIDKVMDKTGITGELEKIGIKASLSSILAGVINHEILLCKR